MHPYARTHACPLKMARASSVYVSGWPVCYSVTVIKVKSMRFFNAWIVCRPNIYGGESNIFMEALQTALWSHTNIFMEAQSDIIMK